LRETNSPTYEKEIFQNALEIQQKSTAELFQKTIGSSKSQQAANGDNRLEVMGDQKFAGLEFQQRLHFLLL
jgi:hypothetical protein